MTKASYVTINWLRFGTQRQRIGFAPVKSNRQQRNQLLYAKWFESQVNSISQQNSGKCH